MKIKLGKIHDVSKISDRSNTDFITFYDNIVAATNGKVAIFVPLEFDEDLKEDFIFPNSLFKEALKESKAMKKPLELDTLGGSLRVDQSSFPKEEIKPIAYRELSSHFNLDTTHKLCLSIDDLDRIVKYAKSNKLRTITFELNETQLSGRYSLPVVFKLGFDMVKGLIQSVICLS